MSKIAAALRLAKKARALGGKVGSGRAEGGVADPEGVTRKNLPPEFAYPERETFTERNALIPNWPKTRAVVDAVAQPYVDAYDASQGRLHGDAPFNFAMEQVPSLLGGGLGKSIMVGPAAARALLKTTPTHPAVAANLARAAKTAVEPRAASIEESGVRAYQRALDPPIPTGPIKNQGMRDAQAEGALNMRRIAGLPEGDDIFQNSGWLNGPTGTPVKEISDIGARLTPHPTKFDQFYWAHPAGDVHEALNVPPVKLDPRSRMPRGDASMSGEREITASADPTTAAGMKMANKTMPHEFQHAAQEETGLIGSNHIAEMLYPEFWNARAKALGETKVPDLRARAQAAARAAMFGFVGSPAEEKVAHNVYLRSAGETDARNVAGRQSRGYSYQQHPRHTEDIPRADQIVRTRDDRTRAMDEVDRILGEIELENPPLPRRAAGGNVTPWHVRQEARNITSGSLKSPIAGRTDRLPINVGSGAYVLPADIVSGIGQGNTSNGMKALETMFNSGPFGMKTMKPKGGGRLPSRPFTSVTSQKTQIPRFAEGGTAGLEALASPELMPPDDMGQEPEGEGVPIMAAGGEFVLSPEQVAEIGSGDLDLGHDILDQFVKSVRKDTVQTLRKLPGPVKD